MIKKIRFFIFLLIFASTSAVAQTTPEKTVKRYYKSIQSGGLTTAYRLIHPKEQERFKSMLLPIFLSGEEGERLSILFFHEAKTASELHEMHPREFMLGALAILEEQMRHNPLTVGDPEIIGDIKEGDVTHVLVRGNFRKAGVEVTRMQVVSLMLDDYGLWRLMLPTNIEGLAQAFKAEFEKERGQ